VIKIAYRCKSQPGNIYFRKSNKKEAAKILAASFLFDLTT